MGRGMSKATVRNAADNTLPTIITQYPELTGTPKQVAWAQSIRERANDSMKTYLYYPDPRESGLDDEIIDYMNLTGDEIENGVVSKDAIKKSIQAYFETRMEPETFDVTLFDESWAELARRTKRANGIFSETSASYWIDHRPDGDAVHGHNSRYKMFKAIIDGKASMTLSGITFDISDIHDDPVKTLNNKVKAARGEK